MAVLLGGDGGLLPDSWWGSLAVPEEVRSPRRPRGPSGAETARARSTSLLFPGGLSSYEPSSGDTTARHSCPGDGPLGCWPSAVISARKGGIVPLFPGFGSQSSYGPAVRLYAVAVVVLPCFVTVPVTFTRYGWPVYTVRAVSSSRYGLALGPADRVEPVIV